MIYISLEYDKIYRCCEVFLCILREMIDFSPNHTISMQGNETN